MAETIRIRRGANIKLAGEAPKSSVSAAPSATYAIKPTDFHGLVPKMELKEGAEVLAGTVLFHDKLNEHVKFVSPVSGELVEIVRGPKRKILEVRILADTKNRSVSHSIASLETLSPDAIKQALLNAGLWPFIKQRPYDVVADPGKNPRSIHISGIDSAPLGVDYDYVLSDRMQDFQSGVNVLARIAKVHLGVLAKSELNKVKNATITQFAGPHPAGNVGVQIHHTAPINKGEVVWTLSPQAVVSIGRFFKTGSVDFSRTIAVAGPMVNKPTYIHCVAGAAIKSLVEGNLKAGDNRIISGNVLSGTKVDEAGYLGFYDELISVIAEGREPQFMGWLAPNFHKFSLSKSYFSWLMPSKVYQLNSNTNGEERPFVVTGQYENVLPMNIYPVPLLKSILANDIDKMEGLGIYEVAPEDFALCEYGCTSKIEVQKIVREGLDSVMKEIG